MKELPQITDGERHWGYARGEGRDVVLLGQDNEPVPIPAISAAARALRAALAPEKVRVCVRLLPPVRKILGEDLEQPELIRLFDKTLKAAVRVLGADDDQIEGWLYDAGMPSGWRGWLGCAREFAIEFLMKPVREAGDENEFKKSLAHEIIVTTSAAAVSMRHGYAPFDFALATGIDGLRQCFTYFGTRVSQNPEER